MTAKDRLGQVARICFQTRLRGLLTVFLVLLICFCSWHGAQWGLARLAFSRAEAALARYDFKTAFQQLEIVEYYRPQDGQALIMAAQAARRGGRPDDARECLRRYRALAGSTPEGRLQGSLQEVQAGDIETNVYELMAKADSGHPAAEQILEALTVGAVEIYHFDQAGFWIHHLLKNFPVNPVGRLIRAQMDDVLGKRDKAAALCRELLADFPNNTKAKTLLAGLLYRAQQFEESANLYGELRAENPDDLRALLGLTKCRTQMGQTEEAGLLVAELTEKFPDVSEALLEAARFAQSQDRRVEAERLLRRAVELAPNDHEVHYQLGLCLERAGKGEEAKFHLEKFKQVEADMVRLDALLKQVVESPKDPAPRLEAGRICLRNNQGDEGLRWLHGALEIAPNNAAIHGALAEYYQGIGDQNLAETHRNRAR